MPGKSDWAQVLSIKTRCRWSCTSEEIRGHTKVCPSLTICTIWIHLICLQRLRALQVYTYFTSSLTLCFTCIWIRTECDTCLTWFQLWSVHLLRAVGSIPEPATNEAKARHVSAWAQRWQCHSRKRAELFGVRRFWLAVSTNQEQSPKKKYHSILEAHQISQRLPDAMSTMSLLGMNQPKGRQHLSARSLRAMKRWALDASQVEATSA